MRGELAAADEFRAAAAGLVDMHCHAGPAGDIPAGKLSARERQAMQAELLALMEANGVARAAICATDCHLAVRNREGNDLLLDFVHRHPTKFIGFASANPWFGRQAVQELERALRSGLSGVKFKSTVQGFAINDPIVLPLLEVAAAHRAPVYFHTGTPVNALPLQVADLAKRFPGLTFVIGHAGYTDFKGDVTAALEERPNVFVETSKCTSGGFLRDLIRRFGPERLVFGSDHPRSHLGAEVNKIRRLGLDEPASSLVFRGNAESLFDPR